MIKDIKQLKRWFMGDYRRPGYWEYKNLCGWIHLINIYVYVVKLADAISNLMTCYHCLYNDTQIQTTSNKTTDY